MKNPASGFIVSGKSGDALIRLGGIEVMERRAPRPSRLAMNPGAMNPARDFG
jgi:hypothetical protein